MEHFALFSGDTYTTPPGREKIIHKLLLRCRLYYVLRFLAVVLRYWNIARKHLDYETWSRASYDMFRLMEDCGGRFFITGLDNLRKVEGPVVFVGNHMSMLETQVPICLTYPYKRAIFVLKKSLQAIPFFGAYVRDCIAVSRTSPADDLKLVLSQGAERIAEGRSIIIFPQATRSVEFIPEKFNSLGVKLARRAGVPVVPIALKTDFWGNGALMKDFGPLDLRKPIHLEFGEPMTIKGQGRDEHEQVMQFIQSRLAKWSIEDATYQETTA